MSLRALCDEVGGTALFSMKLTLQFVALLNILRWKMLHEPLGVVAGLQELNVAVRTIANSDQSK